MAIVAGGITLNIAGVASQGIEIPEWRWKGGKAFRVERSRYVWICRAKPWHRKIGPRWMTEQEIQAAGIATLQTDYYGELPDGEISGSSAIYANARSTDSASVADGAVARVGQKLAGNYGVYRLFFSFDTSGIDDAHDVVAASFYAAANLDFSAQDFNVQLYRYAWLETLAANRAANYDGAYGVDATLEGTYRNTADGWVADTYYNLAVAVAGISKVADTKYCLVSSRDIAGTAPDADTEYVQVHMADQAGTNLDPYLAITTQAPGFAGIF